MKNPSSSTKTLGYYEKFYKNEIKYSQDALKINNKFAHSLKLLAIIYHILGDTEQGENYKKRAIACGIQKKDIENSINYFLG